MKTFNCKIVWNLLPLKCKHYVAYFHRTNLCPFCKKKDELVSHVFYSCSELQDVLDYVDNCLFTLTGISVNLSIGLCLYVDAATVFRQITSDQETAIVLFLSVAKYSIWMHRNSMVYDNAVLIVNSIILDIKNKIRTRYMAEKIRNNKNYGCAINLFHCL